eukprot:CCRYP_009006-RA/>CCRYP_009006-RA protein AED:0.05 eAED:0.14 QI:0/0.5/0.66/1/0/0/3/621/90
MPRHGHLCSLYSLVGHARIIWVQLKPEFFFSPLDVTITYGLYNFGSTITIISANSPFNNMITSSSSSACKKAPGISRHPRYFPRRQLRHQ